MTPAFALPSRYVIHTVGEVTAFLEKSSPSNEVIFCVFDDDTHAIYEALLS
ncbi:hypothetical protein ACFL07_03165 [Pseudomonadota bacterium]